MSSHKHIEILKDKITKTSKLDDSQKSDSMKRIEEWVVEDRAFGILKDELIKISVFFEEVFSELGIK
jgi:hypothetical protein